MFGLSEDIKLESVITWAEWGGLDIGSIPMLRALVKIEIVDATADGNLEVQGFTHLIWGGRIIPDLTENEEWYKENVQVIKPSKVNPPALFTALDPGSGLFKFNNAGKNAEGQPVWYFYLPETELNSYLSRASGIVPYLDDNYGWPRPMIYIGMGNQNYSFYLDNNIKMPSGYGDESLKAILRNHIYRYTVQEQQAQLDLDLDVLPWDFKSEEYPVNYDDPHVSDGGYICWLAEVKDNPEDDAEESNNNGYFDNKNDARLLMKPTTDEYAEATFTLDAPMYGTWVAYLRPINGESDAFYFTTGQMDADGTLMEGGSTGTINGESISLRIACRRVKVEENNNEAVLLIMVQYPDKTQREVNVIDPATNTLKYNYTIVQEVTEIL